MEVTRDYIVRLGVKTYIEGQIDALKDILELPIGPTLTKIIDNKIQVRKERLKEEESK